jgi:hypothetical protein
MPIARATAAVTLTIAALHVVMASQGSSFVVSVIFAGMAGVCGYCALHLWRGPSERTWRMTVRCSLVMVPLHLVLCSTGNDTQMSGMHMAGPTPLVGGLTVLDCAVVALAAVELTLVSAAWLLTALPLPQRKDFSHDPAAHRTA